jgi:branched-chain amino acid aminotransferase
MLSERAVYWNGRFVSWDEARVHTMSHSFCRGSAIFDVFTLHGVPSGRALFRLDENTRRFFRSAGLLGMKLPFDEQGFQQAVLDTVRQNETVRQGLIKVMGFYSRIALGLTPPAVPLDIAIFVLDPAGDLGGPEAEDDTAVQIASACLSRWRKLDPETVPIEAKVAAHYLNSMVARAEAMGRGYSHVVLLDTQGFVAEGGTESLFLVEEGRLVTPALGTVLSSITRKSLLEAAPAAGIEVREERILPERLYRADELFFANTVTKVLPVTRFEDRTFPQAPGPVGARLTALMADIVSGRDPRFKHWLFPVD